MKIDIGYENKKPEYLKNTVEFPKKWPEILSMD